MTEADIEARWDEIYGNVNAAKHDGLTEELEHARFRDSDLSVKGAGLLAFAGLMLACDFVFLSSGKDAFLVPSRGWDMVGLFAAIVLIAGSFCALRSISMSDRHKVVGSEPSNRSKLFLLSAYRLLCRRRKWLNRGGGLTVVGTLGFLVAIIVSVGGNQILESVVRRFS